MQLDLKTWRLIKKLTVKEMADACNVHENTYREWENNSSSIKITNAQKIASILEVELSQVLW